MNVASAQSQTLYASLQLGRTAARQQASGSVRLEASQTDSIEVRGAADGDFVSRVLQDSLEDRLNAALEKAGVDMSAGELLASGLDTSPEATATRIVDFAVGFYPAFQAGHPDQDPGDGLESFIGLLKGAVDEGFAGARELLSGFDVPQAVEDDIDKTYGLVMDGFDRFAESQRSSLAQEATSPAADAI